MTRSTYYPEPGERFLRSLWSILKKLSEKQRWLESFFRLGNFPIGRQTRRSLRKLSNLEERARCEPIRCPNRGNGAACGDVQRAGNGETGVEGSSEKLIFRRGDSRLRTNPLFISPRKAHPSCMPRSNPRLVTTLPQPVSLCARPSFVLARSSSSLFPSLRSSALLRSPPLAATPDCSVSRFAIYSSWRKNERHAARIGLPIFHPCRASRRRISRTRVIIEPRTTTCSEGRAFLLTKLANEI